MGDMKFAEKLQRLCDERGLSHAKLAKLLDDDVSRGTVGNWLADKNRPTLDVAWRLAKLFGVSVDFLADDDAESFAASPSDPDLQALLYNAKKIGYAEAVQRILNPATGMSELLQGDPRRGRRKSS